ncbi:MAG: tetratricopeptide repeat protein [Planctomycetota bacterium]
MSDDSAVSSEVRARAKENLERGYRLALEGSLDGAVESYRRSIALAPSSEAHTLLACALSQAGRVDEAIAECREAIRLDPELGNAWSDLGAYYIEKGEDDRAASYLVRANGKTRFERSHTVHANLGRAHWKQGLLMRALHEFRAAVALEPRDLTAKKSIREILRNFN